MVEMKEYEIEENFFKALLITIGYLALFSLLIFIPLVGFILALTFGAYVAGYRGANYSVSWRLLGLLSAIIWSTIFVILLLLILLASLPFDYPFVIDGTEVVIICIPYALNIIFCVLGARARFKERAEYL